MLVHSVPRLYQDSTYYYGVSRAIGFLKWNEVVALFCKKHILLRSLKDLEGSVSKSGRTIYINLLRWTDTNFGLLFLSIP